MQQPFNSPLCAVVVVVVVVVPLLVNNTNRLKKQARKWMWTMSVEMNCDLQIKFFIFFFFPPPPFLPLDWVLLSARRCAVAEIWLWCRRAHQRRGLWEVCFTFEHRIGLEAAPALCRHGSGWSEAAQRSKCRSSGHKHSYYSQFQRSPLPTTDSLHTEWVQALPLRETETVCQSTTPHRAQAVSYGTKLTIQQSLA